MIGQPLELARLSVDTPQIEIAGPARGEGKPVAVGRQGGVGAAVDLGVHATRRHQVENVGHLGFLAEALDRSRHIQPSDKGLTGSQRHL